MERELERLLPYILGGMFVLGVLLFLLSLYQLRRRRTGAHWRMRRRAGELGGRLFVLSICVIAGSLVLALVSGLATLAYRNVNNFLDRGPDNLYGIVLPTGALLTATYDAVVEARTPTLSGTALQVSVSLTPSDTPTSTASLTPVPPSATASATLTLTATPVAPTDTPTPIPSATPSPTAVILTPDFNVTPRAPDAGFRLTLVAASDSPSADGSAPTAQHSFSAGIKRIYMYFSFDNMSNGVAWSYALLRDGATVQGDTLLWSLGASGSSSFFFGDDDGYAPGAYEVRLLVGTAVVSRYSFTVNAA